MGLRSQISSLYPKGKYEVSAIDKWKGRELIEESVKKFVTWDGEYRVKAFTVINVNGREISINLQRIIKKEKIKNHGRIPALNGQYGVRALMDIPKGTCCGQYFGGEILQDAIYIKTFHQNCIQN